MILLGVILMSLVIIPSRNIHSAKIDNVVLNNNITLVSQEISNVTKVFGNVLDKEYSFNFYEHSTDVNGKLTITPLYEDFKNTENFQFEIYEDTSGNTRAKAIITLKISQITSIETKTVSDEEGNFSYLEITSLSLKTVKTSILNKSGASTIETTTYYTPKVIEYDAPSETVALEYDLRLYEATIGLYTLSDRVSLVGDYITSENSTKVIGTGDKEFSMPSNELIQSGNGELSNNISNHILREYKFGKEVATILCVYGDYYGVIAKTQTKHMFVSTSDEIIEYNNYVIFKPKNNKEVILSVNSCFAWEYGGEISHTCQTELIGDNQVKITSDIVIGSVQITYTYYDLNSTDLVISTQNNSSLPMGFNLYDEVIPMMRKNQTNSQGIVQIDAPLSYYSNGAPKRFFVLGIRNIYKGFPLQELSLQEIAEN